MGILAHQTTPIGVAFHIFRQLEPFSLIILIAPIGAFGGLGNPPYDLPIRLF
ncbi:MAG: hypothetical protein J5680_07635 [Neisseriaceae bacterium]|nr:hypothetical protein [Neisseriaceae bacterium]